MFINKTNIRIKGYVKREQL